MRTPRKPREHRRGAVPACRRHALPGRAVCRDHLHTPEGQAAQTALARLTADLTRALTATGDDPSSPQDREVGGPSAAREECARFPTTTGCAAPVR